jgi:hypothetical protein
MELLPLDSQPRKELKVPKDLNGVVVGQVTSGSPGGRSWVPSCISRRT